MEVEGTLTPLHWRVCGLECQFEFGGNRKYIPQNEAQLFSIYTEQDMVADLTSCVHLLKQIHFFISVTSN
jgi:hypothetical protein